MSNYKNNQTYNRFKQTLFYVYFQDISKVY